MYSNEKFLVGLSGNNEVCLNLKMANRHGLIAGATGTGKTVTLRVLAESFSDAGVPVFMADVKGDLATMCQAGDLAGSVGERVEKMGLTNRGFHPQDYPVNLWDIYQEKGIPLRTTISEMGPLLLSRVLGLNDTQSAILNVIFKIADDNKWLLIDTKDLKAMLQYVGENAKELSLSYGNISSVSLSNIVRSVITLESEGAEMFFGEPALNINEWLANSYNGKGCIQILDCQKLYMNPTMYSTFLLWMLSELFEELPEVGDQNRPRMIFFFDEAHLLFQTANKELVTRLEQLVKMIRSKGVGIYFISQSPSDIPDGVLSQLGNKFQHGMRAYSPTEQKAVKAAAASFRENPEFSTYDALLELGTGEALVSVLDENGVPTMVQRCNILPPQSKLGTLDDATRANNINSNNLFLRYKDFFDRDSAYEFLLRHSAEEAARKQAEQEAAAARKQAEKEAAAAEKQAEREAIAAQKAAEKQALAEQKARDKEALAQQKANEKAAAADDRRKKAAVKSVANSAAGTIGREIGNSVGSVGGKFGKKLGGNIGASLGRGLLSTLLKF